jgi:hypothetical protein
MQGNSPQLASQKELLLYSFLNFGYFLNRKSKMAQHYIDLFQNNLNNLKVQPTSETEQPYLLEQAWTVFLSYFEANFNPNKIQIVPLSGGMDSRMILGALMEFCSADKIHTVTFGYPGSYDFEIGNFIAKKLGTKHSSLSLRNQLYDIEELKLLSKRIDHQTILFYIMPILQIEHLRQNSTIWSGFIGDHTLGSHANISSTQETVKELFLKKNRFTNSFQEKRMDTQLIQQLNLPENFHAEISLLELYELFYRIPYYTAPNILFPEFELACPFISREWFQLSYALTPENRNNLSFYKKLFRHKLKQLSLYPFKNFEGLPLNHSQAKLKLIALKNKILRHSPAWLNLRPGFHLNYADFEREIYSNPSLIRLIPYCFKHLKKRDMIPANVLNKISSRYQRGDESASNVLTLCSLEIHLQAGLIL